MIYLQKFYIYASFLIPVYLLDMLLFLNNGKSTMHFLSCYFKYFV